VIRRVLLATALIAGAHGAGIGTMPIRAQGPSTPAVLTDAVVIHGSELAETEFLDLYLAVPYQTLEFRAYDGQYAAQFTASIIVRDLIGRKIQDTVVTRSILTESYAATQGATGRSETVVVRLPVKPATVRYEVLVKDAFSRREFQSTDSVRVADLTQTPALSSILYLSEIEQRGDRYRISPYVGSTMWTGDRTLFAFFEAYADELPMDVVFRWKLATSDGRALGQGASNPVALTKRTSQHFVPLQPLERALPGSYTLRVTMHPVRDDLADTTVILASTERRWIVPKTMTGAVVSDLLTAIKQLAYVAEQNEIDGMLDAKDPSERQFRFEQFWKQRDPSPQTVRNEAFEEYYYRVATANKRFRSYAEGWLTDMGRVYIVYGDPANIEQFSSQSGVSLVVRWTYPNSQAFVFEDNTGFGDYRLRTPLPSAVKYEYRR